MTERSAGPVSGIEAAMFEVTLRSRAAGALPVYLGSTLRGAFGWMFKKVSCAMRRESCSACMLKTKCAYSYVFETPREAVNAEASWWRRYPQVPHPFVIEPPQRTTTSVAAGDPLAFRLILVGRAREYLPYFICAFQDMADKGLGAQRLKFDLETVAALAGRSAKTIFTAASGKLDTDYPVLGAESIVGRSVPKDAVTLHFRTPAIIKENDRQVASLPFKLLVRSLLRRISALERFHCGSAPAWDYADLLRSAESIEVAESSLGWWKLERYSSTRHGKMSVGGIIGSVSYRGDIGAFWPILALGELLHAGKWTSFGFGKYTIEGA